MEEKERGVFSSACPGCRKGGGCFGCSRREPRGKLLATDWLSDIPGTDPAGVVEVLFKNTRVGFYTNPSAIPLKIGDIVAVEAAPGHDIGRVTMVGHLVALQMKKAGIRSTSELKKVFRIARQSDIDKFEEARAREHSTMIKARSIAEELGLAMKIGDVEYQGDGGKAIFYYIADERVDFRKLIRVLADTFKVRIEMKQIGARQEAGRIGGIGPCGRPLCCSSWMGKFVSVGTGAARLQDLSMNPQKLAGQCAKLKCCLNFEVDAYAEAQKQLPPKDTPLETKDNVYYYFKPDTLSRKIAYSTDKNIPANLVVIDARRAFEIIALNKQGIKVDSLDPGQSDDPAKEYGDIIGQDSLTRFDKSKKKKKKKPAADKQPGKDRPANRQEGKPKQPNQPRPQQGGQPKPQQGGQQRPHPQQGGQPKPQQGKNRPNNKPQRKPQNPEARQGQAPEPRKPQGGGDGK
jgi:cell fate regulator YaaT (PSP1 superfamily)